MEQITKKYDILELQKMSLDELKNLCLWLKLDISGRNKQMIIYDILEFQQKLPDIKRDRVYMVAKISGIPKVELDYKYHEAKKILEGHGYEAVSPVDHVPAPTNWHEAMRICIPLMIGCEAYTCIDEPHTTAGGLVEDTIANWIRLPKLHFTEFEK